MILYEIKGNNKREFNFAKRYYGTFYTKFCRYLFDQLHVLNNYVGQNIKIIRIFFNWCAQEKEINTGFFYKNFYVLHEEPTILTLSLEQLNFLIYDLPFNTKLKPYLQVTKDIFIIGCLTGLRISDIRRLRKQHLMYRDGGHLLKYCNAKNRIRKFGQAPFFLCCYC